VTATRGRPRRGQASDGENDVGLGRRTVVGQRGGNGANSRLGGRHGWAAGGSGRGDRRAAPAGGQRAGAAGRRRLAGAPGQGGQWVVVVRVTARGGQRWVWRE
jgi:hypothetical protein